MNIPDSYRFTETHEWAILADGEVLVGISDHAQEELGDVVYVELPSVDDPLHAEEECGMIDSAKTTSPIYSPVAGIVTRINGLLGDHPELVNQSPYEDGWMFALKPDNPDEIEDLMDSKAYAKYVAEGGGH
jgi:glycine cleavage system H protein